VGGALTYTFFKDGEDILLNSNVHTNLSAGEYTLKATDIKKCFARFDTTFINPDVLRYTSEITQHIRNDGNKTVDGQITLLITGGTSPYTIDLYKEDNPLLSYLSKSISEAEATIDVIESNKYIVHITDANNCPSGSDTLLNIADRRTPTLFTPEGGANGVEIFMEGRKIEVFDRTGTLVHSGNNGWDGKYKGKPAKPATYFYVVTFPDGYIKKGTIQLFKK
jgi:gliding motility-associated-like protein